MMDTEQISFIKACKMFFGNGKHSRDLTIPEFKELTQEDKIELREMLIGEGYDVAPLVIPATP